MRVKRGINSLLTDRTSVSVMFQKVFQKWTSRFWVMRSNSAPLNSGSMAYFPEVKKELAATPGKGRKEDTMRRGIIMDRRHQGRCNAEFKGKGRKRRTCMVEEEVKTESKSEDRQTDKSLESWE